MPTEIIKPKIDPELESLKDQVNALQKELNEFRSMVKNKKVEDFRFEVGMFDIEDEKKWDQIENADSGEIFDYRYIIPIKLRKFSKTPEVFLSITAFEKVDGIWIYADKITPDGFGIILESKYDLDEPISWGNYGKLVISWMAFSA